MVGRGFGNVFLPQMGGMVSSKDSQIGNGVLKALPPSSENCLNQHRRQIFSATERSVTT